MVGMNRSLVSLAFCAVLLAGAPMHAQAANATFLGPIVPAECKCDNQDVQGTEAVENITTAPDYGCVLQVVQNVINFGVTLSTILFTIYLVITGLSFITSGSSSEARSKAKTRFTNVFIGLAVLLLAWLIVDYVMKTVYDENSIFGPWNAILSPQADGSDRCIVAKEPNAIFSGTVGVPAGGTSLGEGGAYMGGGLTYQSEVQKQVPFESGALGSLLSCMAGKLPNGVGQISAITEKAIADGTKSMQQCAASGCAHTANSCHYGGRSCGGYSYAVDFGDEGNAAALRGAARACNPNARWNYEGDHVHISVGPSSGCGCDTGMAAI